MFWSTRSSPPRMFDTCTLFIQYAMLLKHYELLYRHIPHIRVCSLTSFANFYKTLTLL